MEEEEERDCREESEDEIVEEGEEEGRRGDWGRGREELYSFEGRKRVEERGRDRENCRLEKEEIKERRGLKGVRKERTGDIGKREEL